MWDIKNMILMLWDVKKYDPRDVGYIKWSSWSKYDPHDVLYKIWDPHDVGFKKYDPHDVLYKL